MRSQVEQKLFCPLSLGCLGSWGAAEAVPFREHWTGRKGLRALNPSGKCPHFLFCPVGQQLPWDWNLFSLWACFSEQRGGPRLC